MAKRKPKTKRIQGAPTATARGSLVDVVAALPKAKPKGKPKPKAKAKRERKAKPAKPLPETPAKPPPETPVPTQRPWRQVFVRPKPNTGKDPAEILPGDQVTYWSREGGSFTQIAEGSTKHKVNLLALTWSPNGSDETFEVHKARRVPLGQVQSVYREEPTP